jgi:hypothetical protein
LATSTWFSGDLEGLLPLVLCDFLDDSMSDLSSMSFWSISVEEFKPDGQGRFRKREF